MKVNPIKKRYFFIAFFLIVFLAYSFIYQKKELLQAEHLDNITKSLYLDYKAMYNHHKDIADLLFSTRINKEKIIQMFKDRNRVALYEELLKDYKHMRTFYVRQFHFHLTNNDSFLRMHRPEKFGDNLSKVRATVKYVNDNLRPIDGFEEGKLFNGFRFVYPMFDAGEHLGSVEISFSALAFIENFVKNHGLPSDFFILKDIVDEKVIESEKSNYMLSPLSNYFYQTAIVDYLSIDSKKKEDLKNNSLIIEANIQKGLAFSHYIEESGEVATFVPIRNPITNQVVSVLCFYTDDPYMQQEKLNAIILFLSIVLIALIALFLIYKELMYNTKLKKTVIEKTKQIQKSSELLNNVIKGSNLGYWDWYPQTKKHVVNERWKEILGLSNHDITHTEDDWIQRVHPEDIKRIISIIEKSIEEHKPYVVEFRMKHKNGEYVWIQGSGCVIEKDEENRPLRLSGTHADITQRKEAEEILLHQKEILQYQSEHDSLTDLKNRRTLDKDIESMIKNHNLHKAPYAVLMFDIDFFKKVNDAYGHDAGDGVLVALSKLTRNSFRESDKIYRAGGEEFIILLNRVTLDEVQQIAEKFRLAVANQKFQTSEGELNITISAGLYHSSSILTQKVREVLKAVDDALYQSKLNGRNQVTVVKNK